MFEALVLMEMLSCLLLIAATMQTLSGVAPNPELDLGQRAWAAARFSMDEARALGPLFKHLVRAARHGLRRAHHLQERIRTERATEYGVPDPLLSLWRRRAAERNAELAELSHLVEQLEQMGSAIARYRAGLVAIGSFHGGAYAGSNGRAPDWS